MNRRMLALMIAACAALIVFGGVRWLEAFALRVIQPPRGEIRAVSNVILSAAFGAVLYLWLDLRATRAALTDLERSQVVVETQLALAAQVQRRLLPPVPASLDHIRWASQVKPAGRIGGDFYDFIPTTRDRTLVLVGDVSGKGIPAALLQASAHSLFRTFSRETAQPADLLRLVSHEIYAENGGALYLTCLAVCVDGAERKLTYANAGHPAGLLLGRSGRRLLSKGGPPVGMFAETIYQSETLLVEPGDLGVFVTDGITEAIQQDGVSAVEQLDATVSSVPLPWTPERVSEALMVLADRSDGPPGVSNWDDDKTVLAFVVEGERESVQPAGNAVPAAEPQVHIHSATG